ncbi:MAG: tail fiber domain-containing protein [Saprospiraceae bacterium]|nr:tail fiber domain-containing protein [Saprospiraceae bacterium]
MKLLTLTTVLLYFFIISYSYAQGVIISSNNTSTVNSNAMLELESTQKGLLISRMTELQKNSIFSAPDPSAEGMLIYQNDGLTGFYYYDGTAWQNVGANNQSLSLSGNIISITGNTSTVDLSTYVNEGLDRITENSKDGWRFIGNDPGNYGDIGTEAVDLSFSSPASSIQGATGNYSIAMGRNTISSGNNSTAMGRNSDASGNYSTAMGRNTISSGSHSTAMGRHTVASGSYSTSLGYYTTASSAYETAIGAYSTDVIPFSNSSHDPNDRLLVVGNGTSLQNKSDALVLFKNGNMSLAGTLTQSSDARLKNTIKPLAMSLSNIMKIGGYSYYWNDKQKRGDQRQIGVLAQEVQALYPELVRNDGNGNLTVNYSGLVPVLLEATKEQQQIINNLQQELKTTKNTTQLSINDLKDQLKALTILIEEGVR